MKTTKRTKAIFVFIGLLLVIPALICINNDFMAEATTATVSGSCGAEGNESNLTWKLTDDGTLTISGSGDMKNYETPSSVPWYPNRSKITAVIIGDRVACIGNSAFYSCESLTRVIIGDGVTSIGYAAFYDCVSLMEIEISDNVTSIGGFAFYNTGYYNNDTNWKNEVLYIGKYLIKAKEKINGIYTINEGVRLIAPYAFSYCKSLTSVIIPDSVISIGALAFECCVNLTKVEISDGVSSIGYKAFCYCRSLTNVFFHVTDDWRVSKYNADTSGIKVSAVDLSNKTTAATYLTNTYRDYEWKRAADSIPEAPALHEKPTPPKDTDTPSDPTTPDDSEKTEGEKSSGGCMSASAAALYIQVFFSILIPALGVSLGKKFFM